MLFRWKNALHIASKNRSYLQLCPHLGSRSGEVMYWAKIILTSNSLVRLCQKRSVSESKLSGHQSASHCWLIVFSYEFNSLWPSDAIWCHKTWSTLVQVVGCCLTAPNHYLNRCWLNPNEVLWPSPESNFTLSVQATVIYNEFENYILKLLPHLPGAHEKIDLRVTDLAMLSLAW